MKNLGGTRSAAQSSRRETAVSQAARMLGGGVVIGALVVSLANAEVVPNQFEHGLGFELPEPFDWHSETTPELPIFIHCNEPDGGGCPHFDRSHWDYVGTIGAPRESSSWGHAPALSELFHENGWIAMRPAAGEAVTSWRRTEGLESGVCAKYVELDYGYRDALGLTLHVLPCLDGTE